MHWSYKLGVITSYKFVHKDMLVNCESADEHVGAWLIIKKESQT